MEDILALMTVLLCTLMLINAIINLSGNNNQSIFFIYIVFYVFFIIPIIFDYTLGIPTNNKYPNIKIAVQDTNTTLIYYIYMIFVSVFWWIFAKKKKRKTLNYNLNLTNNLLIRIKPLL